MEGWKYLGEGGSTLERGGVPWRRGVPRRGGVPWRGAGVPWKGGEYLGGRGEYLGGWVVAGIKDETVVHLFRTSTGQSNQLTHHHQQQGQPASQHVWSEFQTHNTQNIQALEDPELWRYQHNTERDSVTKLLSPCNYFDQASPVSLMFFYFIFRQIRRNVRKI